MLKLLGLASVARSASPYPRPRNDRAGKWPAGKALSKVSPYAVVCAALVVVVVLVQRCFRRVKVEGTSMMPTLAHGDRLVVKRTGRARVGDLVALSDPAEPTRLLVKRVAAVLPAGLEVRGDNQAASRDSRTFGIVAPSSLVGRAVYRYFPPARVGPLRQPGASSGTLDGDGAASEGHRSVAGA
ncbi:MAG: nickel-type superoxide dismutase maturation protease [Acidimicrobiales bacterium]|jgi:nickel-type superoxide dismutase maturation protease